MKKQILLIVLILGFFQAKACLNYYYSVDNQGNLHPADDIQNPFYKNFNLKSIERNLKKLKGKLTTEKDYKLLSDYAVLLLKAGKTAEATDILSQLALQYPDDYQIIANLGTAYELSGEVEKALEYIKKGIELNPDSHDGSEWVHVRVLETKLKLMSDSSYLDNNSVLSLTESEKNDTLVRNQILHQVRERFPFSPGPNPIMASLLIDLGDCYAYTASIEYAKVLYTIAKLYFGADEELVANKNKEMIRLRNKYQKVQPERRLEDGDNIKIHGLSYKYLLTNNINSSYEINWNNISLNTDTLLSYVNLVRQEEPKPEVIEEEESTMEPDQKPVKTDVASESIEYNVLYLALTVIVALGIGFFVYKKVKR